MAYQALSYLPGVCKVDSAYANSIKSAYVGGRGAMGRVTDMNKARFIAGFPEKIGGRTLFYANALTGTPRGLLAWRDNNLNTYLAIGTTAKLYIYTANTITNVTPLRQVLSGNLTNPLTTNATSVISVSHTAHGLQQGDYFQMTAASAIDGVLVAGTYFVKTVTDANNYTFDSGVTASGSTMGGGGVVAYIYYRITTANSLTTTSGSPSVKVTQSSHGASVGDTVIVSNATAVGGITPNGSFTVVSVIDANNYTYNFTSNATSSAGPGGGSAVNFQYEIPLGNASGTNQFGWGSGPYGLGAYGMGSTSGFLFGARTWSLDHYGQQLLAAPFGGTIYVWDPIIQGRAYPLYGAPTEVNAMFITPERYVFALGNQSNEMQVQWPDQNNYNNWVPAVSNTAEIRTMQNGNYLVGGCAVRDGLSLVFSNTAAFTFNYSGDTFVYDSATVGINTGLTGPLAVCVVGGIAYWFGYSELWMWNGSVAPLGTDDIRDYIFRNINISQASKFWVASNIAKKEVWFGYCSASSQEIDSYVIFHIDQGCFSIGTWNISCMIDQGLYPNPICGDTNGFIYNQESGTDDNGTAIDSWLTFNPMTISRGDKQMDVFGFLPDFERQTGNVAMSPLSQNYPEDTPTVNGPFTLSPNDASPLIDLRIGARMMGYKVESNVLGGDFRLGLCQADVAPAGQRR